MIVTISPVAGEPSPLSLRHAVGVNLDLDLMFQKLDGTPVDPTPLYPQLCLLPRSTNYVYGYDIETVSKALGEARVSVPGISLNDPHDYTLQLYSRTADGVPTALLAQGVLRLMGGAYAALGPFGPMTVPVVEGPPGPVGPMGPQGFQGPQGAGGPEGEHGGTWFTGDNYPGVSMPSPVGRVDGDMYLKNINPDGGSCWRWDGASLQWVYAGANITGPQGVQGVQGNQGPTGNTGSQGPIGNTGAQGPQGNTGNTGNTGATGPQGPAGNMTATVSAAAPGSPVNGQLWYDTTTKDLKTWSTTAGAWVLSTAAWAT